MTDPDLRLGHPRRKILESGNGFVTAASQGEGRQEEATEQQAAEAVTGRTDGSSCHE
jgi:hypothetical protein